MGKKTRVGSERGKRGWGARMGESKKSENKWFLGLVFFGSVFFSLSSKNLDHHYSTAKKKRLLVPAPNRRREREARTRGYRHHGFIPLHFWVDFLNCKKRGDSSSLSLFGSRGGEPSQPAFSLYLSLSLSSLSLSPTPLSLSL